MEKYINSYGTQQLTCGRMVNFQMLCANMDAADSTDESAEDITAADIAPSPTKETHFGVRY